MCVVLRMAFLALSLTLAPLFFLSPAQAQADDAVTADTHENALKVPAGKFVQGIGDRAISIIANKSFSTTQRSDKFRQLLSDSFDLKTVGRFVIGRSWNTATPAQQQEYMRLFDALVVKTYGDRMTLYTGEGFRVSGVRSETEKDFIVNSEITHPDNSPPTVIDWRVRLRDGKLGVIDVVVEGVSLSVTQRQEYAAVIQRSGGQIDGLLDLMRQQLKAPTSDQPG